MMGRMTSPTRRVIALAPMPPEKSAYALARYSRSPDSIEDSLRWVHGHSSEKFWEQFYFDYGHASIADLGHVIICFEGISELAAIHIEDEELWDGQAKSSRPLPPAPGGRAPRHGGGLEPRRCHPAAQRVGRAERTIRGSQRAARSYAGPPRAAERLPHQDISRPEAGRRRAPAVGCGGGERAGRTDRPARAAGRTGRDAPVPRDRLPLPPDPRRGQGVD